MAQIGQCADVQFATTLLYLRVMRTKELIEQVERIPMDRGTRLLEETVRGIREKASSSALSKAAAVLEKDCRENKALTAFTAVGMDGFHEVR